MPQLLMVLVLLGLLSPALASLSVLSGNFVSGGTPEHEYGAAKNIYELVGVVLLSVPIFVASILIVTTGKKRIAVFCFLIGWAFICLSPLCLSSIRESSNSYFIELLMYIVIGVAIGLFLFKNKSVESYLSQIEGSS
jgi:hypothetical protein